VLGHFEAPVDGDEDFATLSRQLVALILRFDVVPFVPVMAELKAGEVGAVLQDVVSESIDLQGLECVVSGMRVDMVAELSGPVDIPKFISAMDIVMDLLWEFLLPQLPMRVAEIDEMIAAAVDDLTIEEAGEPPSNEVEIVLTKYGARGGL
jgi:hypothetical protein